jgi:hypothetical protein
MGPTLEWQPPTNDSIRTRTKAWVNQEIDDATRVAIEGARTGPEIHARLEALDREWHLDRALFAVFSVLGSISAGNALRSAWRHKYGSGWRMLLFTQLGFLMYHAVRGWCPPVAVLRRLGFRTAKEICAERVVLEQKLADLKPMLG